MVLSVPSVTTATTPPPSARRTPVPSWPRWTLRAGVTAFVAVIGLGKVLRFEAIGGILRGIIAGLIGLCFALALVSGIGALLHPRLGRGPLVVSIFLALISVFLGLAFHASV